MINRKNKVNIEQSVPRLDRSEDVVTVQDALSIEQMRQQDRRNLEVRVDAATRKFDESLIDGEGCLGSFCGIRSFLRSTNGKTRVRTGDPQLLSDGAELSNGVVERKSGRTFFGVRSGKTKQEKAIDRLKGASVALTDRVDRLDEKALSLKTSAANFAKMGDRPKALRMLKKSKQASAHALSLQQAADAVERQTDVMADVTLQTQIAGALEASMGPMKKTKKALQSVERVTGDAEEIRDMNEEIQAALSQLHDGSVAAIDEDDLEAELAAMMSPDAVVTPLKRTAPTNETEQISTFLLPEAPRSMPAIHQTHMTPTSAAQ